MTAPRLGAIARQTQRLAVLLSAGVSPTSAWGYLDDSEFGALCDPDEHDIALGIARGAATLGEGERQAWLGVASAWRVATTVGAPLAPALIQFASGLRGLAEAQRDAEVALAGPVASGRLVLGLPVVGIVFGTVLGFDTLRILVTTAPGLVCLAGGLLLLRLARRWTRRMVTAAQSTDLMPGLELELLAIAVSGGGSLERARAVVDDALTRANSSLRGAAKNELTRVSGNRQVEAVLALSQRAGVPAAALLRAEAEEARRDARAAAQSRAASLGVQLMIPLGVCVLPAFMLLGVAPLLISVISTTVANL